MPLIFAKTLSWVAFLDSLEASQKPPNDTFHVSRKYTFWQDVCKCFLLQLLGRYVTTFTLDVSLSHQAPYWDEFFLKELLSMAPILANRKFIMLTTPSSRKAGLPRHPLLPCPSLQYCSSWPVTSRILPLICRYEFLNNAHTYPSSP